MLQRSGLWNLDLRYRTGNISCSKQGQRSACSSLQRAVYSEDVQSTQYCNVLAFGARVVGAELAKMIVDVWLNTEFEGGRHQRRVDMIMEIEER